MTKDRSSNKQTETTTKNEIGAETKYKTKNRTKNEYKSETKSETKSEDTKDDGTENPNDPQEAGEGGEPGQRRGSFHWQESRRLVVAVIAVVLLVGVPAVAWAAPATGGIESVKEFAGRLTTYVTAIAASVAVLFMAVNGIRYITAGGNPMKQSEAKNGIVSAGVGLAVALSANVLVQLVVSALG